MEVSDTAPFQGSTSQFMDLDMPKVKDPLYLYLYQQSWAESWVNGGSVPLRVASTYLKPESKGIYTTDENFSADVFRSAHTLHKNVRDTEDFLIDLVDRGDFSLGSALRISFGKNITYQSENSSGSLAGVHFDAESKDFIILCFSYVLSKDLMRKLGKNCVVKINDVWRLKDELDSQIGTPGTLDYIEYTYGQKRGAFIKGCDQAWQNEARMSWEAGEEREIWCNIPAGIAEIVPIETVPELEVSNDNPRFVLEDRQRREDFYLTENRRAQRRLLFSWFKKALMFNTALTFMIKSFVHSNVSDTLKRHVFGSFELDISNRAWCNRFTDGLYFHDLRTQRNYSLGIWVNVQPYGLSSVG